MAINLGLNRLPTRLNAGQQFLLVSRYHYRVFWIQTFGEVAYFGGVSRWEKTVCRDASTTLVRVIGQLEFWERSVNIGDVEYKKKYILGLIPCLLYQVEYDWKESAWAGRKKVKDTWGLVV